MKQSNRKVIDTNEVVPEKKTGKLIKFSDTEKCITLNFGNPASPLTKILEFITKPILKVIHFKELQKISYRFASDPRPEELVFQKVLDSLDIKLNYNCEKLAQVPREGPLLIVANHPLAMVDGFAIASLIRPFRSDLKSLAISSLRSVPQFENYIIRLKLENSNKARKRNWKATMESIKWLNAGHVLIIFPAGDISWRKLWKKGVADSQWAKGLGLLVKRSKCNVLPVFFHGQTSLLFNVGRSIHKSFGKLLFFRELLLARNITIKLVLGDVLNHDQLAKIYKSQDVVDYLRTVTYSLESVPFESDEEKKAQHEMNTEQYQSLKSNYSERT